jgi:AraC-like DNA-binding protein
MTEILKFIYAIVLFQQAFFIILLIFKSKLKTSLHIIILLLLLSLFFCVADRVINIYSTWFSRKLPWSIYILDTFNLFYLPLIFLFVKDISGRLWKPIWPELIHFTPFLFNFSLVIIHYTLKPASEQFIIQQSFTKPVFFYTNQLSFYIIEYSRVLQIIYVIISIYFLRKFQLQIKNYTGHKSSILNMLMVVLISFVCLWTINLCYKAQSEKYLVPCIDLLIIFTSGLFIYYGLRKPMELFGIELFKENKNSNKSKDFETYKSQLEKFIASNNIHHDPEVTLFKLSELTGISERTLSATINNCYKMHFFDFINSLRIEEAKKALKETDQTVTEILYMVGFNSKSAFNRAFLKHASSTPSKFRKDN